MKKHNITVFILWMSIFTFPVFPSQAQEELVQQLEGKKKLWEIMEVVDTYYAVHPKNENGFESDYLHWKRWEWYMSGRLGHGGEFVNIPEKLMEGLSAKEKMEVPTERIINSNWTFMGPSSSPLQNNSALYNGIGRVDRITFHPSDANIIFIGTPAGGLWRTLNGGSTWTNLTDGLPSLGVSGFVVSNANTNIMYMLTGDGDSSAGGLVEQFGYMRQSVGVLKSTDGGESWQPTGTFPATIKPFVAYLLVQSPTNPKVLLAATNSELYQTTNGGVTWIKRVTQKHYDVAFKPGDGTRAYSTVDGDFWMSTNGGVSWSSNSTYDFDPADCAFGPGRVEIATTPIDPSRVYLLAGPVTVWGGFCGLYLSTDSGASFTRQSNTPNILGRSDTGNDGFSQSFYDLAITCRNDWAPSIAIGGLTVWRSTNEGVTWSKGTSFNEDGSFPYIHPDVHDVAYNPINDWLYAATDGGFFRSQDFGVTWTDLSPTIETSQYYHMCGWDGDINKLMGGLQDNGVKYRLSNSSAFYHISGGDGFDVVFNPDTGEPRFSTNNDVVGEYSSDGVSASFFYPLADSVFFKTLAIHNTDPDILLIGSINIIKTTDGANSFTDEGASGSWALTSCPSNNLRFYAAGGASYENGAGNLYFSGDTGDSWTNKSVNPGFPSPVNWIKITDVAVRPNNSSYVWACFGGFDDGYKVVFSDNTGDTWTNLTFNLPNVPINCLAIDANNGAYVGTDIGVFYLGPAVSSWMPWSNKLPNVPVTELVIFDDGTNKRIRAATFGRGVWQSDLAGTCDAAVIVTGGLEGINHYEATTSISSSSVVQGGIGTFVSFQSGSYIMLTENFMVIDDSEFLGFISPCGQGGIPDANGNDLINRADPNSSIILLRRMWDPEDGMPFGSIDLISLTNKTADINFQTKKPGKVQVVAARQIQDKLITLYSGQTGSGNHPMEIDVSSLPREFHYILLFYEGQLVHYHEMDLR